MTKQIKPSEIRPGMEVQWTLLGVERRCTAAQVDTESLGDGAKLWTPEGAAVHVRADAVVTVLAEPRPEEPTEFGARVVVGKYMAVHANPADIRSWEIMDEYGDTTGHTWEELCALGPVTVIDADPSWTVPTDAPEVPDRIEEWPENDTALRPYKWRDRGGYTWKWLATVSGWECYDELDDYVESGVPSCGPWDRVTDA